MIVAALFLLGLAFGSFLNVLVWRTKNGTSAIKGRSKCPHCHHQLAWFDLIPVISWVWLKRRCRYCQKPIHIQYPTVELLAAGLFGLSYHAWPYELITVEAKLYFASWLVALLLMIGLAVYDLRWMILPDKFTFTLIGVSSAAVLINGFNEPALITEATGGAAVAWLFFGALYYGSGGRWLGGGDLKFALSMGLWLGLDHIAVGLALSFYSASAVVIPLLAFKKLKRTQPVPFGPFLILGTIIATLYAQELIDWYLEILVPGLV